jgi:hypothetical protein
MNCTKAEIDDAARCAFVKRIVSIDQAVATYSHHLKRQVSAEDTARILARHNARQPHRPMFIRMGIPIQGRKFTSPFSGGAAKTAAEASLFDYLWRSGRV